MELLQSCKSSILLAWLGNPMNNEGMRIRWGKKKSQLYLAMNRTAAFIIFFRQTKLKTEKAKALWRLILNNSLKKLESEKKEGFNRTSQQRQTKETWVLQQIENKHFHFLLSGICLYKIMGEHKLLKIGEKKLSITT